MANNCLVSVIIPTHNRPNFLRKTIQSVLNQTYKNLEIIVISNGFSKDNKIVVQEFNDQRIVYLEQENSGGPASPRNHGIRKAKGEYIAFCDDDDLWVPNKIEKQVCILKENLGHGLCYTKMIRFNGEKEWTNFNEEGSTTFKSLLYANKVPISSVVIRKSLIDQFGDFSESKKVGIAEDYEFLLRHSTTTNFYFLDEYMIKYWSGSNRTTSNNPLLADLMANCSYIFACYFMLWKSKKIKLYQLIKPFFCILI